LRIKILIMVVFLMGLLFSLSASAIEIVPESCDEIVKQPLIGSGFVYIDKFDQTLGVLKEVRLRAEACGNLTAEVSSEDPTPQNFSVIASAEMRANLPIEGLQTFKIEEEENDFPLAADDEPGLYNADWEGPDYRKVSWPEQCTEGLGPWTYTDPADLAVFTGNAGEKIAVQVTTRSSITVIGSALQQSQSDAFMGFELCVEYVYEVEPMCINGTKINDCTGLGIEGWEICLTKPDGETICTMTDANGDYSFCDLEPGDYTVTEEDRAGWVHLDEPSRNVPLIDVSEENVDFLNTPLFCISGHKFNSKTGEALSGWTINLKDATGAVIDTTTTGTGGYYEFCELASGDYEVCEVMKPDWKAVGPICIPVTLDCANSVNNDFYNEPTTNLVCICPFFIKNELYSASFKEVKVVDASKGVLANDRPGSVVLNPDSITIDPKYGTITVEEDGSFIYDPTVATGRLYSGLYVMFKYNANNGFCDSVYPGIAKIQLRS